MARPPRRRRGRALARATSPTRSTSTSPTDRVRRHAAALRRRARAARHRRRRSASRPRASTSASSSATATCSPTSTSARWSRSTTSAAPRRRSRSRRSTTRRAFGVVPTRADGEVIAFVEKPPPGQAPSNWINAGHLRARAEVLDRIPPRLNVSIERETFPRMLEQPGRLFALRSPTRYWLDIGTPEKYLAGAARRARRPARRARRRRCATERGRAVLGRAAAPTVDVDAPVLVGPARRVGRRRARSGPAPRRRAGVGARTAVHDASVRDAVRRLRSVGADAGVDGRAPATRSSARRRWSAAERSCCRCRDRGSTIVKALVTGGAGFIGSTLVDRLLAEGWRGRRRRRPLDRLAGQPRRRRARSAAGKFSFHRLDVRVAGDHRPHRAPQARRRVPPRRAGRRARLGRPPGVRRRGQHPRLAERLRGRARGGHAEGRVRGVGRHALRHARASSRSREGHPQRPESPVRRREEGGRRLPALLPRDPRARVHRARARQRLRPAPGPARRGRRRRDLRRASCSTASGRRSSATASRPATSSTSTTSSTRSCARSTRAAACS